MAKKRRKKSSKCPEPFNTLIDLAAGATMNAIANKMEEKHHYRKRGVPNPYRASAIGLSTGRLRKTEDIIRLGGFLGAMGSFDPDDTETDYHYSPSSSIGYHIDEPWEFDNMKVSVSTNNNRYAWRMNCEDGSAYGIYPHNYETRQAYNSALAKAKEGIFSTENGEKFESNVQQENVSEVCSKQNYTYCKVSIIDTGKNDYYLMENIELSVGDTVLVPTEKGNLKAIILQIKTFSANEVPKPIDKTESIIKKVECF